MDKKLQKGLDGQKFIHIQNKYAKDYFLEENKDAQRWHLCQSGKKIFSFLKKKTKQPKPPPKLSTSWTSVVQQ